MAKMLDWTSLKHTYGAADDIPYLLEQLSPDPSAKVWDELWERLYHQGTVYSASFAIIPYMLEAAHRWPPAGRLQPLVISGTIVAADEVVGSRDELVVGQDTTIQKLLDLTIETLPGSGLTRTDRIYLLGAALAFKGLRSWEHKMSSLADGELPGHCPHCQADLYVVVGKDGFFIAAEEWLNRPKAIRSPISPADACDLPGVEEWLHSQSVDARDAELTNYICYLCGAAACPSCGADQKIPDLIS